MAMRRNMDTKESQRFWKHAEETAREVDQWPEWMRGGVRFSSPKNEEMKKESDSSSAAARIRANTEIA
jgi:hypothetical protein